MNPQLIAQMTSAARILQGWTGETVTIGGEDYTCTSADLVTGNLSWEQGGTLVIITATITILQADLLAQPAIDTLATFRGNSMRVKSCNDGVTLWNIVLAQEKA